jgi:hypothetical protein
VAPPSTPLLLVEWNQRGVPSQHTQPQQTPGVSPTPQPPAARVVNMDILCQLQPLCAHVDVGTLVDITRALL